MIGATKSYLKQPNGNGVFVIADSYVVVVYDCGFRTDYIFDYCPAYSERHNYKALRTFNEVHGVNGSLKYEQRFGADKNHSKTTTKAIVKALDYVLKNK